MTNVTGQRGEPHFVAFVLAAHPRPVAEAIESHRRDLDEDPEGYLAAGDRVAANRGPARAPEGACGDRVDVPLGGRGGWAQRACAVAGVGTLGTFGGTERPPGWVGGSSR